MNNNKKKTSTNFKHSAKAPFQVTTKGEKTQVTLTQNGTAFQRASKDVPKEVGGEGFSCMDTTDSPRSIFSTTEATVEEKIDDEITIIQTKKPTPKRLRLEKAIERGTKNHTDIYGIVKMNPCPKDMKDLSDEKPTLMRSFDETVPDYRGQIRVEGYHNYLRCPIYSRQANRKLIWKIRDWMDKSMQVLVEIDEMAEKGYKSLVYKQQYTWAKQMQDVIDDIFDLDLFPIHILNKETIMQVIDVVDDDEKAIFVQKMSTNTEYQLVYIPFEEMGDFLVYTRFGDSDTKYGFGKNSGITNYGKMKNYSK